MSTEPIRFPANDTALERDTYHRLMTASDKGDGLYDRTVPLPMTDSEWYAVHAALEAAGRLDVAARLMSRRLHVQCAKAAIHNVAHQIRDRHDSRKVSNVTISTRVQAEVNFGAHGCFGVDGDLRVMAKEFEDAMQFRVLAGLGLLTECVRVRSATYCG